MKDRKTFGKIILVLFAVFLLAETSIRILVPSGYVSDRPLVIRDDEVCFRNNANLTARFIQPEFDMHFSTNSLGYRMDEVREGKHILMLGDSFLFGTGVQQNETVSYYVENLTGIQTINTGVQAYNTAQYLGVLKKTAGKFNSSYTVVLMFMGSDISTEDKQFYENKRCNLIVEDNILVKNITGGFVYNTRKFLANNLRTYNALETQFIQKIAGNKIPEELLLMMKNRSAEIDGLYETEKKIVGEMNMLAAKSNNTLIVVIIPTKFQAHKELLEAYSKMFGINYTDISYSIPNQEMAEFFASQKITYIDMLPEVENATMADSYFFLGNGHFNKKGNWLMAQKIAERIENLEKGVNKGG